MKKVRVMLNDLHIIKQLSRLFRSTHERRESDAAELFLDVNDANETEEALDAILNSLTLIQKMQRPCEI